MGTRGIYGIVINGEVKISYNHSDSYPSGLGEDVLAFARSVTDETRTKAAALRLVVEEDSATDEDVERLRQYANTGVASRNLHDWYVLLRHTQGDLAAALDAGVMINGKNFAMDSLFCEWGYLVDLDERQFEVYRGFQKQSHAEGRFAGLGPVRHSFGEYWPIRRVASWPLGALPESLDEEALLA